MVKKLVTRGFCKTSSLAVLLLLAFGLGSAFAQTPAGLEVGINVEVNGFELREREKSDVELRREAASVGDDGQVGRTVLLPFGSHNWYNGTSVSFSYNGGFYGARLSLDVTSGDRNDMYWDEDRREWRRRFPISAGDINAWLRPVDYFRIAIGRGIASNYADTQGGEALRVFTGSDRDSWDASRSVDDIVQNEGVLLEGFFGPVSLALAGRYYDTSLFGISTTHLNPGAPPDTMYAIMKQRNFSYGVRIGGEIGPARISASYILEFDNITGRNFNPDREGNLVPITGEAEFTRHLFGIFASLAPFEGFGVSIGYSGVLHRFPDQIYSASLNEMRDLTLSAVLQQGISLNARYSGVDRWVFRTDHNVSFWGDKDFSIYGFSGLHNAGVLAATDLTRQYPTIGHFLVWNGVGANYRLTDNVTLDLYVRNLHRRTLAEGLIHSGQPEREYLFTRNKTVAELRGKWHPRNNLEFYVGLDIENTITTLSRDVAFDAAGTRDGFARQADAKEIRDTDFVLKIPVGITVKIR